MISNSDDEKRKSLKFSCVGGVRESERGTDHCREVISTGKGYIALFAKGHVHYFTLCVL